jgi:hypothetical protein
LPLGSKGQLDGESVDVIGFMVRRTLSEGIAYDWREYLLAAPNGRYRWLTEYNHHWNVVDVLSDPPAGGIVEVDAVRYRGTTFKHFSTAQSAEVIQLAGSSPAGAPWRKLPCRRLRRPPQLLSCESNDKEITWSLGRYACRRDRRRLCAEMPEPARLAVAGAGWSNFILALLFVMLFPLFSRFRHAAFEGARWADSDHAPAGGDSGDDD